MRFCTDKKRRAVNALLGAYRSAVNFYIRSLWTTKGKLDKETLARLPSTSTKLSERYKSQALKQALEVVISTKKAAKLLKKRVKLPHFNGPAILDHKFVTIEEGKGSFDLVIKVSMLKKGRRTCLPTRHTDVTRKWQAWPGAKLIQGCALDERGITVFFELPPETLKLKQEGSILAIDLGVHKLFVDSDGTRYGEDFKRIRDKILRRQKGSKGKFRAYRERDNYIRLTIKQLPWDKIRVLGVEELKGIKRGKKKNRNKAFRRAMAPWICRKTINWIEATAQENRVLLVRNDPANTSRTCPECGAVSILNRKGEDFPGGHPS